MRLNTKQKRLQARDAEIEYLKSKGGTVQRVYDIIIVRFSLGDKLCVKIYKGTSYHPVAYYSYKDEGRREESIDSYIASAENRIARKIKTKRENSEFVPTMKAGDILYDSWGYDQTNIDFWQVLSVHKMTATVMEIGSRQVDGTQGFMCCNVMPKIDCFVSGAKLEKKRICRGDVITVRGGSSHASRWDGSELYCSWYA